MNNSSLSSRPIYGLIGSGRLARHLAHYLSSTQSPFKKWARKPLGAFNSIDCTEVSDATERLKLVCESVDCILLALRDDALADFIQENAFLKNKILVHFSGSLSLKEAYGFHPLMSFSHEIYPASFYQSIPFVGEKEGPAFNEIFPDWSNPFYRIESEQKPLYHSLCVASGNFTTLLWKTVADVFEFRLGLPKEVLWPYLRQISTNIEKHPESALTGPLVRNDQMTINKNLEALGEHPLADIYRDFIQLHQRTNL